MQKDTIDAAAAKVGVTLTYSGSGAAIVGGLTLTEWAALTGIVTAIAGLIIQLIFSIRRDRQEERIAQAKIESFRSK